MSVSEAVQLDLDALGDDRLAKGALAATALELASQMDNPRNSATSKSMCAKSLTDVLARLRDLAPPQDEDSPLTRIRRRRDERTRKAK